MFAPVVLVLCVLTAALAQSPMRTREYITIFSNNNIYYGDRSHIKHLDPDPECRQLDRDLVIDKLVYDRITIEHRGRFLTATGEVTGVGVRFQKLQEQQEDFRTLLLLVFSNEQEYTTFLTF